MLEAAQRRFAVHINELNQQQQQHCVVWSLICADAMLTVGRQHVQPLCSSCTLDYLQLTSAHLSLHPCIRGASADDDS